MPRIRHWALKAATQKALSVLPGGRAGNRFLQRYVTRSLDWKEEELRIRLGHCRKHLENYFSVAGKTGRGFSVLELGTGSYPVIPIGMYLCGASGITTVDIDPLLSAERTRRTLHWFCKYLDSGELVHILPWVDEARARFLLRSAQDAHRSSAEAMLGPLGIHPVVGDVRKLELASGSVDFIFSNGALQDIPEEVLRSMFTEFARLATRRAVMSHHIYMGDTFAAFDCSITPYNFLRFSHTQWKLINNSIHSHNRLRISDYYRIHQQTGWRIATEDTIYGSLEDLRKVPLAEEFQAYSQRDLLALRSWLASRLGA